MDMGISLRAGGRQWSDSARLRYRTWSLRAASICEESRPIGRRIGVRQRSLSRRLRMA
jgi:hypothetical protein